MNSLSTLIALSCLFCNCLIFYIVLECKYILIFNVFFIGFVVCLNVETHVPDHAITNGMAHLDCVFKLEDERLRLEAVKWHKDQKVFYVYSPDKHPTGQVFSVPGVNANVSVI